MLALLHVLTEAPDGALLAVPVRDTLKRAHAHAEGCLPRGDACSLTVAHTVPRAAMYHALTPQAFPLGRLLKVLVQAVAAGVAVTDESSAMEWAGGMPRLVLGHADNLKITQPEDLSLARLILQAQLSSNMATGDMAR